MCMSTSRQYYIHVCVFVHNKIMITKEMHHTRYITVSYINRCTVSVIIILV